MTSKRDVVALDNRHILLRKGLGHALVNSLARDSSHAIRAALWHDSVLILEFCGSSSDEEQTDAAQATAVIDTTTGKVFAYYDPRGALHRLPKPWT